MTIAAGFRCRDGVLILVDSQHSVGNSKYQGPKLWEIEWGKSSVVVTAAGDDSSILEAVEHLRRKIDGFSENVGFQAIDEAIRSCKLGRGLVLLVGAKLEHESTARLLRVEEDNEGTTRVNQLPQSGLKSYTFSGTYVAEAMCNEMFDWLFSSAVPVLQMKELAAHALGRICEYAQWCSWPIQSAYLLDEGARIEYLDDFKLPEYAPKYRGYLCGVQHLLGQAIRACVDFTNPNDAECERHIQDLADSLREMRRHSKSDWMIIN
jgi:hypothetical protein